MPQAFLSEMCIRDSVTSGTARLATTLLETLRLEAYTPELPIQEDRIHVANGTLFLNGEFRAEKEFCRNRLPVNYEMCIRDRDREDCSFADISCNRLWVARLFQLPRICAANGSILSRIQKRQLPCSRR